MDKQYKLRIKIATISAWVLTLIFALIYASIGLMSEPTHSEISGLLVISFILALLVVFLLLGIQQFKKNYFLKRLLDPFIDAYFTDGTKYLTQSKDSFRKGKFEETVIVYRKGDFDIELTFYDKQSWFGFKLIVVVKGVVSVDDHPLIHRLIRQHAFGRNRVYRRPMYSQLLIAYEFFLSNEDNVFEPKDYGFYKQTKALSVIINPKDNKCFVRDDVYKIAYTMRPYWKLLKDHFMVNLDKHMD